MRYRVHYLTDNRRRTAQVEASSPQEAVVKFRHTRAEPPRPGPDDNQVLSVMPELDPADPPW